jgi:hypothetical protein
MKQLSDYFDKYINLLESEIKKQDRKPEESLIFKEVLKHRVLCEELLLKYNAHDYDNFKRLKESIFEFISNREKIVEATSIQSIYKHCLEWLEKHDILFLKKYLLMQKLKR